MNDEADAFWDEHFGGRPAVPTELFAARWGESFTNSTAAQTAVLAALVVRHPGDPGVTRAAFAQFVARFGPFARSYDNASALLDADGAFREYFHGHLRRAEAEDALQKPGDFLVRFSRDHPDHLTLTFARDKGGVLVAKTALVRNAGAAGFARVAAGVKTYPTLCSLIKGMSSDLQQPAPSRLRQRLLRAVRAPLSASGAGGRSPVSGAYGRLSVSA